MAVVSFSFDSDSVAVWILTPASLTILILAQPL